MRSIIRQLRMGVATLQYCGRHYYVPLNRLSHSLHSPGVLSSRKRTSTLKISSGVVVQGIKHNQITRGNIIHQGIIFRILYSWRMSCAIFSFILVKLTVELMDIPPPFFTCHNGNEHCEWTI